MATLGYTTHGASSANVDANFAIIAGPYVASEAGTIDNVVLYLTDGSVAANEVLRGVVYKGAAENTATLLCRTAENTYIHGSPGEYTFTAASEAFTAGDTLWIGWEAGATSNGARYNSDGGQTAYYVANTYPTAPDPFGSTSSFTAKITAYINYTPSIAAFKPWIIASRAT